MASGTKRGQFFRSSQGSFPCMSPQFVFVLCATIICFFGYNYWSQSHRMNACRAETLRLREISKSEVKNRLEMQGRLTELHLLLERQTKLFAKMNKVEVKSDEKVEDKDKRILTLENEVMQLREKVERCNFVGPRLGLTRSDEGETNGRSTTAIRNKTMCDQEMFHQFEEIDKWIKSMVDDRTYSQFQLKFSKDGEKTEADKLQRLEKVVNQRDEIKAVKDEKIKEEIRAREKKDVESVVKTPEVMRPKYPKSESIEVPSKVAKKII